MSRMVLSAFLGLVSIPAMADSTLCATSSNSTLRVLKSCSSNQVITGTQPSVWSKAELCLSREERSGGPFGGETIPWFYTNIRLTSVEGKELLIQLENPDGHHNFRSPIDYSDLDLTDGLFLLESHRTKYPNGNRRGHVDQHIVNFNFTTDKLEVWHNQRSPIQFGKWREELSFAADCR